MPEACAAVAAIVSEGGSDRATVVASVSGVTAIVNAIAAHPSAMGVQLNGSQNKIVLSTFSLVKVATGRSPG